MHTQKFHHKIFKKKTVYQKVQKKYQKISINEFSTYWHEPQTLKKKIGGKSKKEKISKYLMEIKSNKQEKTGKNTFFPMFPINAPLLKFWQLP